MSLELRVNGKALALYADTEADMELVNAVLAAGMEDSYSLPFRVPVAGNEVALEHVAELGVAGRTLEFDNAELWHQGVRLARGVLEVTDSEEQGEVSVSFSIEGFVSLIQGLPMNEVDYGEPIVTDDIVNHAVDRNDEQWPTASHCFPMYFNPSLHGNANPNWYPDAPEWSASTTYNVNDLVTRDTGTIVRRTRRYQCISGPHSNQDPETATSYWRETAFGIVNHWDHATPTFFTNSGSTAEYYAMVPWFYLKYYVQKALAHYGLTPTGEWWNDTRYHQRVVMNNTTLDRPRLDHFFHAMQTGGPVSVSGNGELLTGGDPEPYRLPCDDESTVPASDADGVWDNSGFKWTCPAAGTYMFRAWVPPVFHYNGQTVWVGLYKDGSPDTMVQGRSHASNSINKWGGLMQFQVTCTGGDVGSTYYISAFYTDGSPFTFENCWVQGWRVVSAAFAEFDTVIDPADHAPAMTVDEFLLDLRDTYNLHLRVDRSSGTVHMDYAERTLDRERLDWSGRQRSRVALDHTRRVKGYRYAWDVDTGDEVDLRQLHLLEEYDCLTDVTAPGGPGVYAVIKSSRELLVSGIEGSGNYVWYLKGYLLDEVVVGDEEEATTVTPRLGPMMMVTLSSNGEDFLMPMIDEEGNSRFFPTGKHEASLRVADYLGKQNNANAVRYPFATPWGRSCEDGSRLQNVDMNWEDDYGPYTLHHARLAALRVNGDPVRMDVELDHPALLNRDYERVVHMNSQDYLVERLPVKLGRGPLLAEMAELVRINPLAT